MLKPSLLLVLIGLPINIGAQRLNAEPLDAMDRIQGKNFPFVEKAVEAFRLKNKKLDGYIIRVKNEKERVVVIFTDKDRAPRTKGSGKRVGFEVTLDPRTLKITQSHFVR